MSTVLKLKNVFYALVDSRAPLTCIRCRRLRNEGRMRCGRCGDIYQATPLVDVADSRQHSPPAQQTSDNGE